MNEDYFKRAVKIAQRDGIPPAGSDEIRLHGPLEDERYITTDKAMVSFRVPNGRAVALMERLWSDDEHTHIVGRTAVVVNPATGKLYDMGLFFQEEPGGMTSILSTTEIQTDKNRGRLAHEGRGQNEKMNAHVKAFFESRNEYYRGVADVFLRAASVLDVRPDDFVLRQNRHICAMNPRSYLVPGVKMDR